VTSLRWTAAAVEEAEEAAGYYGCVSANLGAKFANQLAQALQSIRIDPHRFARLETIQTSRKIHRTFVPKFPYLIIDEIRDNCVEVLAIAHTSRAPDYWLERRADT